MKIRYRKFFHCEDLCHWVGPWPLKGFYEIGVRIFGIEITFNRHHAEAIRKLKEKNT